MITVIERHNAAVRGIAFNPHSSLNHLLAAGSADGDISIINLENPKAPTVASYVPILLFNIFPNFLGCTSCNF